MKYLFLLSICLISVSFNAQSVGINTEDPHPSAILDINSNSKGLLIPIMDSTARKGIVTPDTGLLVYDTTAFSFYYWRDTAWRSLSFPNMIQDTDGDTKIWMEKNHDEDWIRFNLDGKEKMFLAQNSFNHPLLYLRSPKFNTAVGSFAGVSVNGVSGVSGLDGGSNSFFGWSAGRNTSSGHSNVFLGTGAGLNNTIGLQNVFIGSGAGFDSEESIGNIFVGYSTGAKNEGSNNIFIGNQAGINDTIGNNNIYLGNSTGSQNPDGTYNVIVGQASANFMEEGSKNTILGGLAGNLAKATHENTYLGYQAGAADTIGIMNTIIGAYAGANMNGTGNVFIGYESGQNYNGNNHLVIENIATTQPLIYGKFADNRIGINWDTTVNMTTAFNVNGKALKTDGSGNWLFTSDKRLKTNINSLDGDKILKQLEGLEGVTYNWNSNPINKHKSSEKQYGFIAQDIQKLWPEKVHKGEDGYLTASYGDFDPMIIEAIKALNKKVNKLEQDNAELKKLLMEILPK
ncbi:MAG: tail fiber domain-containing protein [Saprospiraceae bacterium]|nr:tail fiber domain-containing protein [Saprospiraceae bacterium]